MLSMYLYISDIDWVNNSGYIKDKNYYTQMFLEKYKHVRKKERSYFFTNHIEIYSDNSDDSDEKVQIKRNI